MIQGAPPAGLGSVRRIVDQAMAEVKGKEVLLQKWNSGVLFDSH
jgi:hypothetical protein